VSNFKKMLEQAIALQEKFMHILEVRKTTTHPSNK